MDKRINKKVDTFMSQFKDSIKNKVTQIKLHDNDTEEINNLMQYIYDYERLCFTKEDFTKRKRVKNVVNLFDRCCARRSNGEQCSRRKKESDNYCGTHLKGIPHGIVETLEENAPVNTKMEVWVQDIMGIMYYIDKNYNVYQAEDIISNKTNPKIIAKYVKNGEVYTIPSFEL